ncbi:hypothetical protein ACF8PU_00005 [Pseudomonas sp. GLN_6]|uniref:hypothetical protein n=1 Tax=Pseudomonas sp. GLN_6 TaxID=3367183 RepID=UPI00370B62AE
MKQHNGMKKPFKAKALLAIVAQPLAVSDSSPRLTNGSKRSLRSLGPAKAGPLTKRYAIGRSNASFTCSNNFLFFYFWLCKRSL